MGAGLPGGARGPADLERPGHRVLPELQAAAPSQPGDGPLSGPGDRDRRPLRKERSRLRSDRRDLGGRQAMRLALAAAAALLGGCGASPTTDETAGERYHEANALFERGRYDDAIPMYESAISVRDRLKDAYYKLAYCYEARGEESHAVEALEKAVRV